VSTTDIYVESVLVGFLVLVMLGLPFSGELLCAAQAVKLPEGSLGSWIVGGAATVGVAYLLGIVADRLIDSALESTQRHARLQFAAKQFKTSVTSTGACWPASQRYDRDYYREDDYRTEVLLEGQDAANEFVQYVRTRIRLLRATLFTLPGLTYGAAVAVTLRVHCPNLEPPNLRTIVERADGLVVGYVLMFLLARVLGSLSRKRPSGRWTPPRTDELDNVNEYLKDRGFFRTCKLDAASLRCDVAIQPNPIGAAVVLGWAFGKVWPELGGPEQTWVPISIVVLGAVLTRIVYWAWWRTTFTYMTYLRQFGEALEEARRAAERRGKPRE
jgi:hypothetical protein